MAQITLTGNVGKDLELKTSQSGKSWCSVSVAWSERVKDAQGNWDNGPTLWVSVRVFGQQAEHAVQTLRKGMVVVAAGDMKPETWSSDQGEQTVLTMMANSISPALFNQTAQVSKVQREQGSSPAQSAWNQAGAQGQTAQTGGFSGGGNWGQARQPGAGTSEDPPF